MIPLHLLDFSAVSALGPDRDTLFRNLIDRRAGLSYISSIVPSTTSPLAEIPFPLPSIPPPLSRFHSRCHRIAFACLRPLEASIRSVVEAFGADRVGVVCGTSASGNRAVEESWRNEGDFDFDYHHLHTFGCVSQFLKQLSGIRGPAFSVSTACSSGSNALMSAARLIHSGSCDAVLTGAADSLCLTTYHGFQSLQIVDPDYCKPFDADRKGLNLGEGAAFFILASRPLASLPSIARLLGMGASSDGYHMTAPDPEGHGAMLAMQRALEDAGLSAGDIDTINLHGTGTPLNDMAEARAVRQVFGEEIPCSSTKGYTGHLLGAAAAIEIAVCILSLQNGILFANHGMVRQDPDIRIRLLSDHLRQPARCVMKNSFAFGGNNTSLVFGV